MENLNAEQVKKALECHADELNSCGVCPYREGEGCSLQMSSDALSLIKELTEENEKLKAPKYFLHENGSIEKLTNEVVIARMGGRNYGKIHELARAFEMAVRADTVRKMQERLRFEIINKPIEFHSIHCTVDFLTGSAHRHLEILEIVDQIAKEMLDEG